MEEECRKRLFQWNYMGFVSTSHSSQTLGKLDSFPLLVEDHIEP